jgi:hypothetical protein
MDILLLVVAQAPCSIVVMLLVFIVSFEVSNPKNAVIFLELVRVVRHSILSSKATKSCSQLLRVLGLHLARVEIDEYLLTTNLEVCDEARILNDGLFDDSKGFIFTAVTNEVYHAGSSFVILDLESRNHVEHKVFHASLDKSFASNGNRFDGVGGVVFGMPNVFRIVLGGIARTVFEALAYLDRPDGFGRGEITKS